MEAIGPTEHIGLKRRERAFDRLQPWPETQKAPAAGRAK